MGGISKTSGLHQERSDAAIKFGQNTAGQLPSKWGRLYFWGMQMLAKKEAFFGIPIGTRCKYEGISTGVSWSKI